MKYDTRRTPLRRRSVQLAASLGAVLAGGCASVPAIAPVLLARAQDRTPPSPDEVTVRWLGVAGFELRAGASVLLLDPYLSRSGLAETALGHLASDEALLEEVLPEAQLILIGHSHFDHLLDAPAIARRTGAAIVGTRTTCWIAGAMGTAADRCRSVAPNERFELGPFAITAIASRHASLPVIGVPVAGVLDRAPRWKHPHAGEMPMGGALIWVIRVAGLTIVHISSAGLPEALDALNRAVPEGADLVLAGIASREGTPGYARRLIAGLSPRALVPHHYDPLFGPIEAELPEESQADLKAFVAEARGATVMPLPRFEAVRFTRASLNALSPAKIPDAVMP